MKKPMLLCVFALSMVVFMAACSKSVENQDNVAETEVSVGEVLEMPVSGSVDTSVIAESRAVAEEETPLQADSISKDTSRCAVSNK